MRLVRDHSDGAYAVSVPCLAGDGMVRLCEAVIDIHGPAFQAYYHQKCAPDGDVPPCNRDGCAHPECNGIQVIEWPSVRSSKRFGDGAGWYKVKCSPGLGRGYYPLRGPFRTKLEAEQAEP